MTITDTSVAPALSGITQYSSTAGANATSDADLGQDDFLTLMTAQLQNQDPFAPMENGDFLAQMAQFSTVSGIEDVNETLGGISSGMGEFRVSTAATLLGQHVLVPGTIARPDQMGSINGVVDLDQPSPNLNITYEDANTGEVFHTQTLGYQSAGLVGFEWNDIPQTLQNDNRAIRVTVRTSEDGQASVVGPSVFARVMSVSMAENNSGMNLDVEDYGILNSMEINQLR